MTIYGAKLSFTTPFARGFCRSQDAQWYPTRAPGRPGLDAGLWKGSIHLRSGNQGIALLNSGGATLVHIVTRRVQRHFVVAADNLGTYSQPPADWGLDLRCQGVTAVQTNRASDGVLQCSHDFGAT